MLRVLSFLLLLVSTILGGYYFDEKYPPDFYYLKQDDISLYKEILMEPSFPQYSGSVLSWEELSDDEQMIISKKLNRAYGEKWNDFVHFECRISMVVPQDTTSEFYEYLVSYKVSDTSYVLRLPLFENDKYIPFPGIERLGTPDKRILSFNSLSNIPSPENKPLLKRKRIHFIELQYFGANLFWRVELKKWPFIFQRKKVLYFDAYTGEYISDIGPYFKY